MLKTPGGISLFSIWVKLKFHKKLSFHSTAMSLDPSPENHQKNRMAGLIPEETELLPLCLIMLMAKVRLWSCWSCRLSTPSSAPGRIDFPWRLSDVEGLLLLWCQHSVISPSLSLSIISLSLPFWCFFPLPPPLPLFLIFLSALYLLLTLHLSAPCHPLFCFSHLLCSCPPPSPPSTQFCFYWHHIFIRIIW